MADDELNKMMNLLEYYKEQMGQLEMQSQYIQAAIVDYNKVKITIENLDKEDKNAEVMLPIGGGTYINAKVPDPKNVLFDVGAGVVTGKTVKDAKQGIDKRIKELENSHERLMKMYQDIQKESIKLSEKAQDLFYKKNNV
jgi:prefoldin alpha subunit